MKISDDKVYHNLPVNIKYVIAVLEILSKLSNLNPFQFFSSRLGVISKNVKSWWWLAPYDIINDLQGKESPYLQCWQAIIKHTENYK